MDEDFHIACRFSGSLTETYASDDKSEGQKRFNFFDGGLESRYNYSRLVSKGSLNGKTGKGVPHPHHKQS